MKLQPRQIIGLFAIVVFGGGLILRLTQPSEREIMEKRLASLPTITPTVSDLPPLDLSEPVPIAPLDLHAPASGTASDTPIWMIGDHLENDVAAPKRHGMRTVWFNPERAAAPQDPNVRADREIAALAELMVLFGIEQGEGGQ